MITVEAQRHLSSEGATGPAAGAPGGRARKSWRAGPYVPIDGPAHHHSDGLQIHGLSRKTNAGPALHAGSHAGSLASTLQEMLC